VTQELVDRAPFDLAGEGVRYEPLPGFAGLDSFTYRVDDGGSAPAGGESRAATVALRVAVGPAVTLHEFLGDDTDPGWSVTGQWEFGPPAGGGSHDGDPPVAASGVNVYGYNLAGDYTDDMGREFLTSAPLDLSRIEGTTLEFQRWLGVEGSVHDRVSIEISTDGSTWSDVWSNFGPPISDSSWSLQVHDVSAVADRQAAVRFRWVMGETDSSGTYPGWNIDDVLIRGVVAATCSSAPPEVPDLRFVDRGTLEWNVAIDVGNEPPHFDTIRSLDATDFVSGVACVEADGADTMTIDRELPAAGMLFHYLVRAENDCGGGPLGAQRIAATCLP